MLSFKDLEEVLQPKAAGEKRFKDKHVVDTIDYPLNDAEINKGTKKSPAKKKRIADSEEGKDAAVYEENITKCKCETCGCEVCECKMNEENEKMTPAQEKKREEIVMAMKKDKEKLQSRYGESWKAVMYATATKQAMSESFELDEAIKGMSAKDEKALENYMKKLIAKMSPEDKEKIAKDPMGAADFFFKSFKQVASKSGSMKFVSREEVELDEALPPHLAKYIGKDGDFTPEVKKRLGKDFMKRMQVPSKKKSNVKDVTPKGYGPNEELDESAAGIAQLKKAYEPLRGKKISLDNAKKLSAIMDKFADDKAMLMKLVKADIPFVTQSAVTKLITKHNMKGAEINKMRKEEAGLDEKAPKMKMTDIMNRKKKPKTYQVDIDGSRATVTAASEKMAIQKAMTKLKINKKIKPLPKATVKVMEEVGLDEANPAKMSDDVLKSRLSQMEKSLKTHGDSPAIQFEIKRLKKEMKKRGIQEEVELDEKKVDHQLKIAIDTVKNPNKGKFLGGPSAKEAEKTLRTKYKYTDKMIAKLKEEVDLDEAFKINATNQKLNDGSMVKISKDDASALNGLYNSLNPANAKTMSKKMMQDKKSYGEILAFAKQAM